MISVCMATYNGACFIKEQIDSILPQLASDDELIVSDDGSTDGTLEIVAGYGDKRIKVLHHVSNNNYSAHEKVTANFENALMNTKGDYIFLADQDDIWEHNKVSFCMEYLKKYDFVVHAKRQLIHDGNSIEFSKKDIPAVPRNWILHLLNMKWYGCCMAFSQNFLKTVLPFPNKLVGHDYWISALALRFFSVGVIENPLITYRVHASSVSYRKKNSLFFKIIYRINLIFQVAKRRICV